MDKLTISDAVASASKADTRFARLLERATFDVGMYVPETIDPQKPHTRDELYVIARGSGDVVCADETEVFHAGDVFFVPAGVPHRFANFSADFSAWVIFLGPRASS